MKNLLFSTYLGIIKFFLKFTKTNPNGYVILNGAGRSGSNGFLFYQYLINEQPNVDATLVEPFPSSHLSWQTWKKIAQAKYIFTTHGPFKIKKAQVNVEFWHGIPLKKMGLMANNTDYKADFKTAKKWNQITDIVSSSSSLYETTMTACVGVSGQKYQAFGFPRIDALFAPKVTKQELLKDLFGAENSTAKIGIYMPTFRFELDNKTVMNMIAAGNFFAFDDFDGDQLNQELKAQNQYLIIKLHPYEQQYFQDKINYSNIVFLTNEYLNQKNIDLYQMLGSTDYLLTDFSSIYFDYLHLNKPIYFVENYRDDYLKARGILFEPYDEITPGAKISTQQDLVEVLQMPDKYQPDRKYWLDLTYNIDAKNNCDRIFTNLPR